MVFFTCNSCGTALKKNQVERHMGSCGQVVSCIDCLKDFRGQEFQAHTKCISEEEKYNGPDWKAPSSKNKGERKQLAWVETVNAALEKGRQSMTPAQVALMKQISKHDNVPRKKAKFMNFVKNIAKNSFDLRTIEAVWDSIEGEWKSQAEQEKLAKEAAEQNNNDETTNGVEQNGHTEANGEDEDSSKKSKKDKKKKHKKRDDEGAENGIETTNGAEENGHTETNGEAEDSSKHSKKDKKKKRKRDEDDAAAVENGDVKIKKKKR